MSSLPPFQLNVTHNSVGTTLTTSPGNEELHIPRHYMEALEGVLGDLGHGDVQSAVDARQFSGLTEPQFNQLKDAFAVLESKIADGSITVQSLQLSLMSTVKERAVTLDAFVDTNIENMKSRNAEIADVSGILDRVRSALPIPDEAGQAMQVTEADWAYFVQQGLDSRFSGPAVVAVPGETAVTITTNEDGSGKFLLDNLKTKVDELSSNSQLEMIQLQGMINKRNQSYELLSTIVKQFANSIDKTVSNLR